MPRNRFLAAGMAVRTAPGCRARGSWRAPPRAHGDDRGVSKGDPGGPCEVKIVVARAAALVEPDAVELGKLVVVQVASTPRAIPAGTGTCSITPPASTSPRAVVADCDLGRSRFWSGAQADDCKQVDALDVHALRAQTGARSTPVNLAADLARWSDMHCLRDVVTRDAK
jgi:hypothetical protein